MCLVIAFTDVIIIVILITTVVRIQDLTIRINMWMNMWRLAVSLPHIVGVLIDAQFYGPRY